MRFKHQDNTYLKGRLVEVLNRLRHPNMVILLGACPEYDCLVYEHMENGSLEDRLYFRNSSPSIPWATLFRIAAEIATALPFPSSGKARTLRASRPQTCQYSLRQKLRQQN
ncbi:U-box domain-containing 52-like [Olea europaea subsp. europaea]|uniref:RING-type E3 ubiquitin transferase n=1 Tax=Olea europaea subsp. europaea TaxID=158383 RepID=A0A8S0QG99_OLEEU|nr:U-box domain-containing 52-like [Olea europaea subsp. europaea]